MASTPRKRPIMMLSMSMHSVTVMEETICVTIICRKSLRIMETPPE